MRIRGYLLSVIAAFTVCLPGCTGDNKGGMLVGIHSHNDYDRNRPFYDAFDQRFGSIEADVYCVDGELYVAHDRDKIEESRTLRAMYLEPVKREAGRNGGSVYGKGQSPQLLIDLKTNWEETLPVLAAQLDEYGDYFDPARNPHAVRVTVSGSMPRPELFGKYPEFIFFDGRPVNEYTPEQLKRLSMISASFGDYSRWNGNDDMSAEDSVAIKGFIDAGHAKGQKVRFWGCPDTEKAWLTFMDMGVDIINTDRVAELGEFIRNRQRQ